MICLETQKIYSIIGRLEAMASESKTAMEAGKLKAMAAELTTIVDNINVEMDCMED